MIQSKKYNWKTLLLVSGIAFQIIFLLEVILLSDYAVIDPSVHIISFANWKKLIETWDPSGFWAQHGVAISAAVRYVNAAFQLLFGAAWVYLFIKNERFSLSRRKLVLGCLLVALIAAAIRVYIKYNVDYYRLYMYSIFTELLAVYMIRLSRSIRRRGEASKEKEGS